MALFTFNIIKIFLISFSTAMIAVLLAPILIRFLYKIKFWKKQARTKTITGDEAKVFYSLHKERETTVPRGGGLIIWISVVAVFVIFSLISKFTDIWWLESLDFLSRGETWLPLFTLITASLVGL
jgi:UDP-N-acetylmuramyl pentapeptide phosphotransferase/UDP-N-acetylglucosamine-1-phosphate transferase